MWPGLAALLASLTFWQGKLTAGEVPATVVPPPVHASLREVLRVIEATGNVVEDRGADNFGKVTLPNQPTPFWPLLDELARQTQRQIVPRRGGGLLLLPQLAAPAAAMSPVYAGPFRARLKQVTAMRHFNDPALDQLVVMVELLWEPRLSPWLLRLMPSSVRLTENSQTTTVDQGGQVTFRLLGEPGLDLPIRLPLPARQRLQLDSLTISAAIVVPPDRVVVPFERVEPTPAREFAGIQVRLRQVDREAVTGRWQVVTEVTYPNLDLESHQAWVFGSVQLELRPRNGGPPLRLRQPDAVSISEGRSILITHQVPDLPGVTRDYALSLFLPATPVEHKLELKFHALPLP
jgi:hypothetical protein